MFHYIKSISLVFTMFGLFQLIFWTEKRKIWIYKTTYRANQLVDISIRFTNRLYSSAEYVTAFGAPVLHKSVCTHRGFSLFRKIYFPTMYYGLKGCIRKRPQHVCVYVCKMEFVRGTAKGRVDCIVRFRQCHSCS